MKYIHRRLETQVIKASGNFPAVLLTGPRRSGKTTLLRRLFPKASYFLIEDPDIVSRLQADPRGFLNNIKPPVILDEIQNVPELINYVRTRIDSHPHKMGQWILTGSQDPQLMKGVTESLAGRTAILTLLPLSVEETDKVKILTGGFPEVITRPSASELWFQSYIQTYLERDVRHISDIRDLATYRRFLALAASRCGAILNRSDFAAGLGVSVPTISQWLSILEITQQIILLPPFYENFGKRLVKSPRLYFSDTGLLCHLLGIVSGNEIERSPFKGDIFENFVISEIIKQRLNAGRRKELYYFRDAQGLEVDVLVPGKSRELIMIEIKAGGTVFPVDAGPLKRLQKVIKNYRTKSFIVYRPSSAGFHSEAVSPGVKAKSLEGIIKEL